jgi:multicomponent Na+:H+ antiporter subunit B
LYLPLKQLKGAKMTRKITNLILLLVIFAGVYFALAQIPFGENKMEVSKYYINDGVRDNGAANIVTSVVLNYRGFDTLGEVTVLFVGAVGLGMLLFGFETRKKEVMPVSLIVKAGCRFLFPLILLVGTYIFIHGHLTPGGGFQGGAIIASWYLLSYLGCLKGKVNETGLNIVESLAGTTFVIIGLLGLIYGGYFLLNFLPKGTLNTLVSAGILPLLYIAIGFKVSAELSGIIYKMME